MVSTHRKRRASKFKVAIIEYAGIYFILSTKWEQFVHSLLTSFSTQSQFPKWVCVCVCERLHDATFCLTAKSNPIQYKWCRVVISRWYTLFIEFDMRWRVCAYLQLQNETRIKKSAYQYSPQANRYAGV